MPRHHSRSAAAATAVDVASIPTASLTTVSLANHPLAKIPTIQRVVKFASSSLARVVILSHVTDIFQETVVRYGSSIVRKAASFETEDFTCRSKVLELMVGIAHNAKLPAFLLVRLMDAFVENFHPASILKRVPGSGGGGGVNLLHMLCYRHCDLVTAEQQLGRLLQLKHLIAVAPCADFRLVAGTQMMYIGYLFGPHRDKALAKAGPRRLAVPPWSRPTLGRCSPLQISIDGRANEEFLLELVNAPRLRHAAASPTCPHYSHSSSLLLAASAANPVAMKVLLQDCGGLGAKLLGNLQHDSVNNGVLATAVTRWIAGVRLFHSNYNTTKTMKTSIAPKDAAECIHAILDAWPIREPENDEDEDEDNNNSNKNKNFVTRALRICFSPDDLCVKIPALGVFSLAETHAAHDQAPTVRDGDFVEVVAHLLRAGASADALVRASCDRLSQSAMALYRFKRPHWTTTQHTKFMGDHIVPALRRASSRATLMRNAIVSAALPGEALEICLAAGLTEQDIIFDEQRNLWRQRPDADVQYDRSYSGILALLCFQYVVGVSSIGVPTLTVLFKYLEQKGAALPTPPNGGTILHFLLSRPEKYYANLADEVLQCVADKVGDKSLAAVKDNDGMTARELLKRRNHSMAEATLAEMVQC